MVDKLVTVPVDCLIENDLDRGLQADSHHKQKEHLLSHLRAQTRKENDIFVCKSI